MCEDEGRIMKPVCKIIFFSKRKNLLQSNKILEYLSLILNLGFQDLARQELFWGMRAQFTKEPERPPKAFVLVQLQDAAGGTIQVCSEPPFNLSSFRKTYLGAIHTIGQ